jgi:ABC-2 type transport system ATP-binding protein
MDEAERLCDRVAIMDHGKVIALGTPQELIRSLGAEHVVEFATPNGTPLDIGVLEGLDGVRAAREAKDGFQLEVDALHRTVPALLAELSLRGVEMSELRTRTATLEDVFVSLTGRHLRDD